MSRLHYRLVEVSGCQSNLTLVADHAFSLMMRNVGAEGFVFNDPEHAGVVSAPGCVIASPSWENGVSHETQDYVYNWTRVAAIVALELAAGPLRTNQPLIDYVQFARISQTSGAPIDRAAFLINGAARDWSEQSDGPALQTLAILRLFGALDQPTQAVGEALIDTNLMFLLGAYQGETVNIWEEHHGASFFARAVQLRCFREIAGNTVGVQIPGALVTAIDWLENALQAHWNGQYYQSVLPPPASPYDPNIDVVMAAVYGAVAVTDTKLLATAALLRDQWENESSSYFYPINGADRQRGIGPLLGRYPGDVYDGDTDEQRGDHPWAVSTCVFAELYYRLAHAILAAGAIPLDDLSSTFFSHAGVDAQMTPAAAAAALRRAGDKMLHDILFHSDHLVLSEQFDATTGYQKSVSDLSWSYAAFLSAIRPSLSTSDETLTIEESMNLEGENGERRNVGDEHEWS